MKVRYLDSRDVESLTDAMASAARKSSKLDLAAAFLTTAGAEQVLSLASMLSGPASSRQVRVLVGTWLDVSEPRALRRLRRAKGVVLRVSKQNGFHVKHLSLRGKKQVVAFTGSANFTAKGLGGAGELVAEITDKAESSTDRTESDAFRRLWEDAYPDTFTDEVIAAYAKSWKPPRHFPTEGPRSSKKLLKLFGASAARASKPLDDGSVLWFPTDATVSSQTVEALKRETGGASRFVGLGSRRSTFERVQAGTRHIWILDLEERPKDRTLEFHQILREVELPTEQDGRYFAVLTPVRRVVRLTKKNRQRLKELGLVRRVDSLASGERTLRTGTNSKAAAVWALSQAPRR